MTYNTSFAKYPSITFAIVTLNEERRIEKCLSAIKKQKYPGKLSIIVVDGGSIDKTVAIAKKYGAHIIHNEKKLAEPGLAKAYSMCTTDYMVFMAADNIVFDKNWTIKIVQPFLDNSKTIYASFSKAVNDPHDNAWNKYINEDTEPFSAFIFGNASHPDKFERIYPLITHTDAYQVYKYDVNNFPLIALAQCTVLKTKLKREGSAEFDDILPLIHLIEQGKQIAYVTSTGIYHYSFAGFTNYRKKMKNRIYNSMKTNSYASREAYVSKERKIRRYLFLPYSLTVIFPLFRGVILALTKKNLYMLLHPVACFIIGYYILYNAVKIKLWEK